MTGATGQVSEIEGLIMRELRSQIEAVLQDYRDEAANEERFVSEILTVLAMGSVARARMMAEMAQVVARHTTGLRSGSEDREFRKGIEDIARFDYESTYKQ